MTTQEKAAAGRRARLRSLSAASEFHGSVWSCCHYTNEHRISSGVREDKGRHSLSKQQRRFHGKRPRNELNRSTKIHLNLTQTGHDLRLVASPQQPPQAPRLVARQNKWIARAHGHSPSQGVMRGGVMINRTSISDPRNPQNAG